MLNCHPYIFSDELPSAHFKVEFFIFLLLNFKVKVKDAQECLTLCNPMDGIVPEILQARILVWVAFPFSRESSQPRDRTQISLIAGGFFTI